MAKAQYAVVGGTTRKIKKKYAVVDGQTRKIKREYAVIDGKTRLIYSSGGGLLATGMYTSPKTYYALKSDDGSSWEEIEAGENCASTLSSNVKCYFWKDRYIRYDGTFWYSIDGSVWTSVPAVSTMHDDRTNTDYSFHNSGYNLQIFLTDNMMYAPYEYRMQTSETLYRKYHYIRKIDSNFNSTYVPVAVSDDNGTYTDSVSYSTEWRYSCFCYYIDPVTKVGTYYVLRHFSQITSSSPVYTNCHTDLCTWNGSSASISVKKGEFDESVNAYSQMIQFGSNILIHTGNYVYEYVPSSNTITSLFSTSGSTSTEKSRSFMQKIDDTHFVIYNTKLNKVFYYTNSGSAWTRVSTGTLPSINGDYRTAVQFIENDMYVISYESNTSPIKYINYSKDFGVTWTQKEMFDVGKTVNSHYAFLWTEQEAKAGD